MPVVDISCVVYMVPVGTQCEDIVSICSMYCHLTSVTDETMRKVCGEVCKVKGQKVTLPVYDKVLLSTELVLDDQGQLREGNRVHGENDLPFNILM